MTIKKHNASSKRNKQQMNKPPNCLLANKESVIYMYEYTVEYYSATREEAILPFVTTRVALEATMLSEIREAEKDNYGLTTRVCGILRR